MATPAMNALVAPVRAFGPLLLASMEEPHAELLALVWGPRFDRAHAQDLLQRLPQVEPAVIRTVEQVATQFDRLAQAEQQRVRQLILRHRSRWDNAQETS